MKKAKFNFWFKLIFSFVIIIALFVTSCIVSFNIFKENTVMEVSAKNIAVSSTDPECYYMRKASPNIAFEIQKNSAKKPQDFQLTNSNDKKIKAVVSESKNNDLFVIEPPKGGYKSGEEYTLVLAEGTSFAAEELAKAKKLVFSIESKEIERHEFADTVIEVEEPLSLDSSGRLILPEGDGFEVGKIVFGKNEMGDYDAYKIVSISGGVAIVEVPAADEVYEELRIYKEFEWDVSKLREKDLTKETVVDEVVSSAFYSDLVQEAYTGDEEMLVELASCETGVQLLAAQKISVDDFEFEYEIDEGANTVSISITIPIYPGKAGLFGIDELKSHSIKLNLSTTIGCSTYMNFNSVKDWDLSYSLSSDFSWSVDIEMVSGEISADPDLDDFYKKTSDSFKNQKYIKKIADKLERFSKDHGDMNVDLFEWKIPTSVPGVFFEAEIEFVVSFEMSANITIGNSYDTYYTAGICLKKGKFDYYTNEYSKEGSPNISVRGAAGLKLGIQLECQLCFIKEEVAYIGMTPQVGAYVDLYALAPIQGADETKGEKEWYIYIEPGVYAQVELDAYVNLFGDNDLYFGPLCFEKKWAVPKDGFGTSKISICLETSESTVFADKGSAKVPQIVFEYYDATSGVRQREVLDPKEYKLYDKSGNGLTVSGGKVEVPNPLGEDMVVVAKYTDENDRILETEFVVTESVSVVEGRVSAFNRGVPTALADAKVSLYKIEEVDTSIASKITESDGEFRFNVEAGVYKLVISAEGYKTLVTTQAVGENETKYTEHLLLIDETMDGKGVASGIISDALNGNGVSNATIKLRNEWNNTEGEYVEGFSTKTDSSGRYVIEDMPIGYYTIEASADGYITTHSNILVLDEKDLVAFDFAMTPTIEEGKVRIILNWGSEPSDLDSHLLGRTPTNGSFNVYYSSKIYSHAGIEMANLDHDDTSSYGPETVTILENIHGTYTYAVHDYSNRSSTTSNALSYSGARVRVMIGGRDQIQEFYVPTNRTGVYWTVFTIDSNYNVIPINTISNYKPEV